MELVPATAGTAVERVESAELNDVTKSLIKCHARVSDFWDCVVTSYTQSLPETNKMDDDALDWFKNLCGKLGLEIMNLISDVVGAKILDIKFKEIYVN